MPLKTVLQIFNARERWGGQNSQFGIETRSRGGRSVFFGWWFWFCFFGAGVGGLCGLFLGD